jgi:hypothetical protein
MVVVVVVVGGRNDGRAGYRTTDYEQKHLLYLYHKHSDVSYFVVLRVKHLAVGGLMTLQFVLAQSTLHAGIVSQCTLV